jgi:tetratricopeptide (TPR) repeat protein
VTGAAWLLLCVSAVSHAADATAPPAADLLPPVAAPTGPSPADAATAPDPYPAFRAEFEAGRYTSAVPLARQVLERARQQAPQPEAEAVQVALMNLATTLYLAGDYVDAESSFREVIAMVEGSGRPMDARLARAYAGLAAAYHDADRHQLAIASFERALALSRRHEGLLNAGQATLLEKYADSLTQLGRYQDALQAQRYLLRVETRRHGEDSVELVPTLEKLGRWYASVGAYDPARRTLYRAIDIVEGAEGKSSPRLVGPLLALASTNRRQLLDPTMQAPDPDRTGMFPEPLAGVPAPGSSPTALAAEGERALQRAASIAEQRTDLAPLQVAEVRLQLGDWYQIRGQPERALPHYRLAWQAGARVTDRVDGRRANELLFGKPVLLHMNRPDGWNRAAGRPPERVEVRNVVARLEVDAQGRVRSPELVDDSGDARRGERTLGALGSARYRPRFEDGAPVATPGVEFLQPWVLERSDEPAETAPR